MNTVNVIGRLTRDPELRHTNNDTPVTTLRIAVQRRKGRDGTDRGAAFVDVVAWNKTAEVVTEHLTKGRQIAVTGYLDQDEYEHEGQKRDRTYIVANDIDFIDRPPSDDAPSQD